jgi:hypothetical protein
MARASSHSSDASAAAEVGENMIPDVIGFEILSEYRILVTLSNGKQGIFDVKPYLDKGIFTELKDYRYFKRARIEYGTIAWPNEQDFSPETIEIKDGRDRAGRITPADTMRPRHGNDPRFPVGFVFCMWINRGFKGLLRRRLKVVAGASN